jgi:two-component system OmpR family response regulator
MPRVLVVDDEPYLADLVATALRYEGFDTATAGSGRAALSTVHTFRPDLLVLDVMLPDGSGVDTCRQLRRDGWDAPIVFLTARAGHRDTVTGLLAGGDDYVSKPFSLAELIARIRVVLRRAAPETAERPVLSFADVRIDDEAYEVTRGGTRIDLTPTEYRLLRYLVVNAGKVVTKQQILDHVWDTGDGGTDAAVQTYVSYLRRKLAAGGLPLIHTVPRVGYVVR